MYMYMYVKKLFKHSTAEFQSIQQFWKSKNGDVWIWGNAREDQKPETFFLLA